MRQNADVMLISGATVQSMTSLPFPRFVRTGFHISKFPSNHSLINITITNTSGLMPNTHRRRRRDETVLSRRVGVGGVYMNSQLAHDDCRRIRSTIMETDQIDSIAV